MEDPLCGTDGKSGERQAAVSSAMPRVKVKEVNTGLEVRMRTNLQKENWSLQRTDRSMLRSSKCWETGNSTQCALMV